MSPFKSRLVHALTEARRRPCFPPEVRTTAEQVAPRALGLLFPHFSQGTDCSPQAITRELEGLEQLLLRLEGLLSPHVTGIPPEVPSRFIDRLSEVHRWLEQDAQAIYEGDPAARSVDEVILTYPGFYAIAVYRLAHELYRLGMPMVPRLLTEHAHQRTGVDIHPGATIGRRFCIDHGTGVVIGETTTIGNGVKLYQGVTLGALTVEKALADRKRHPTLEDRVVVYANATILGGHTVIGHDTVVAGNAFLTQSVPPFSLVTRRAEVRQRTDDLEEMGALEFHI